MIRVPDASLLTEIQQVVARFAVGRVLADSDAIFFGVDRATQLGRVAALKASLKPDGALWVIRPKGRPEISEQSVMAAGKQAGLVDVKVVSLSSVHTAEKFVIPVAARARLR